PAPESGFIRDP
uniref:Extended FMRFamide-10 n=1 Tax=Austrophasma rawsonvillense TaxID=253137 RepID=FAR10_AUSRA|nr:RecName: Full=Extended FMRFamide-10; Short=FMRFa-10 [Austrophasma rawsonvillense]